MDFSDKDTINNLIFLCLVIFIASTIIICKVLEKKGINVRANNNQLKIGLALFPILLLPFWLADISLNAKLLITFLGPIAGIGQYYSTINGGKWFRKTFGLQADWEKEEEEKEKQAKEKKEIK